MTRFGEIARRRIQRREFGVWETEARAVEEFCHSIEQFRELDDSTRTGWSTSYRERRKQKLVETLKTYWPELSGENRDELLRVLTDALPRWNRNERRLDGLSDAEIPREDPFASGDTEELTFKILKQDTVNDRKANLLYNEYFLHQDELSKHLSEPLDEFPAFSYWLAMKTLIYGLEYVPRLAERLHEYYPKAKIKQIQQFRWYAQINHLKDMRDPYTFLSKVVGEFPELVDVCGGMLQTYADAVRADASVLSRTAREELGLLPDMPNTVIDLRKQDLWQLRQRIRNAYVSTGDFKRVAKAFERSALSVHRLLIDLGVMEQRGMQVQTS